MQKVIKKWGTLVLFIIGAIVNIDAFVKIVRRIISLIPDDFTWINIVFFILIGMGAIYFIYLVKQDMKTNSTLL